MIRLFWKDLTIVILLTSLFPHAAAKAQDVDFCSFTLSEGVLQAHTNFNLIYEFDVDQHGAPTNIKPITGQFVKPRTVQACIERWSLPQSALKHLVAIFEWHHATGWTKLAISGPDTKLTIHLSGQRCPYCTGSKSETSPK
jgi:hypothetical protein